MLAKTIAFTIERRFFILVMAAVLTVAGFAALWRLPFDAFPDTTPVLVQINATAPGWAPEEMERLVTFPVERAMSGLPDLSEMRSISKYGLAQVTLIFNDGTDIYRARQQATERLVAVELPGGVAPPQLGPVSTGLGEVFHYVVLGKTDDPTELRTVQDWVIKPQLQSVPGVVEVNSWGGFEKQYQVLVDPNKLVQYDLKLSSVVEAAKRNIGNVPGGEIVRGGERTVVRGLGHVSRKEEIESIVIDTRGGIPIHMHDIGEVVIGHELRRGATTYDGKSEVVLGLAFMLTGENSREVTARLARQLEDVRASLPSGVEVRKVYSRDVLVKSVLETVEHNLFLGAALVVAILFVFLGSLRAGLIVASAIPLSMIFAVDMMTRLGIAGSLMSLGAIDFGLAVDNAVIQVENTVRRLSQAGEDKSRLETIRHAILEVRKPTLFGELIIILVYLPVLTLQGVEGKLFRPMALTVVLLLTGSLLLSFTVIPAMIATFLPRTGEKREPVLVVWSRRLYKPVLDFALRKRRVVVVSSVILLLLGGAGFVRLGSEFIPRLSEGTIVINLVRLAGVSLEQSVEYGMRVERILKEKFPDEISHVWTRTGTAELATDPMGLEVSDVFMTLNPRDKWKRASSQKELVEKMNSELSDLPGMNRIFTQPIEMRVNEMVAGIRADVGIKLFGDDLDVLSRKAEEIASLVKSVAGNADVAVEQMTGQPNFELEIDRGRLARFALTAEDVLDYVEIFGGIKSAEVYEGQKRYDLAVLLDPDYRRVPEDIERIPLKAGSGELITLDRVTTPRISEGPSTITREWGKRRIVVQCNVRGRDAGSFVAELQRKMSDEITLPPGYFVRFGGQFENMQRARARLLIVVPVALILIFGLLYWSYRSVRDAILIFSGVPFAAMGGVAGLAVGRMPLSISAAVGFIALSGIAVLNGLVLVSTIKRYRADGMEFNSAIRESGLARVRPVLMTALVASLGFVPMVLSRGVGAEVQRPLATVVVGGILTSTALTLIVLPVLYSLFGKKSVSEI
ncbi:MAG: CusA/CzcA family heavy metal efflux RND transporter [Candidatus Eisenbacteria bacterium]|nr:CusA/CzcA family heavy metal efflux RND transporter [Candidatus Eisenbacteria bacterium]